MTEQQKKWLQYLNAVGEPFIKLARLEFLLPDGQVGYVIDNNPMNRRSGAFIQSGTLSVNLQNGQRRTAEITLANIDGEYEFNVNKAWFGNMIRLEEGLILPSGEAFYLPQGVFYIKDPGEAVKVSERTVQWHLTDKWSYLDGTLFGNLDGIYEVPSGSNIFHVIQSVLKMDRGNGLPIDPMPPIFTDYYNGKTQETEGGGVSPLINTPYTYRAESAGQTYADVVLEMNNMLAGWIGYDCNGQLRMDASQDDVDDKDKPVVWDFSPLQKQFLGAAYSVKNSETYNDVIIEGQNLSGYGVCGGRAINLDPKSDTNVYILGRKLKREPQNGYYSPSICESLAKFKLKRYTTLQKEVSITSSQIFHLQENQLVTIRRPDKDGMPLERHLVTGFERSIAQNGDMTITATSVNDYPEVTTEVYGNRDE